MRKKRKLVFDGQVYAQKMTGQYRYADEILMELDKIIGKGEYEIVVPSYVNIDGKFKIGRAIPFIIPNIDNDEAVEEPYFLSASGISKSSTVLSPVCM